MKTILITLLLGACLEMGFAAQKFALMEQPEAFVPKLVTAVQIEQIEIIKSATSEVIKVRVKATLTLGESSHSIDDVFAAKVSSLNSEEKSLKLRLFARDLAGPCDYNGFQKLNLSLAISQNLEILPDSRELKLNLYQRDLDCFDKYQAFASDYL